MTSSEHPPSILGKRSVLNIRASSPSHKTPRKIVRITLLPSPPPEFETNNYMDDDTHQLRRSERIRLPVSNDDSRVILPTDPVEYKPSFHGSAGTWQEDDLQLLKVRFDPDEVSELSVLEVEHEWKPRHRQRIYPYFSDFVKSELIIMLEVDDAIEELNAVTWDILEGVLDEGTLEDVEPDSELESGSHDHQDTIERNAPNFATFFKHLRGLISMNSPQVSHTLTMSANQGCSEPASVMDRWQSSESGTGKRPNSLIITPTDAKKQRVESPLTQPSSPITPNRPTTSKDPDYSGDSNQSTGEDSSKAMTSTFVERSLGILGRGFLNIPWTKYARKSNFKISGETTMKFELGNTTITAISDGGLNIECYCPPDFRLATWAVDSGQAIKPVLSFETRRKGNKGGPANWKHAGQIFAEMLGQVCYPEFYRTIESNEYLEAFIIHVRHTTASIFYCQFPVSYLRNIAKHGANYRVKVPSAQGVHLEHSQSYHLYDPVSRAGFFRIFARMMWYLSRGKSHVPYLWNRPDNPINTGIWSPIIANPAESAFWDEPPATWPEPVYPAVSYDEELSSSLHEEQSFSNYTPSEHGGRSASED